ncbi:ankyrin repeat-containing domain protein [Aspergillus stella-maris]|uniref:ankyrin repeat-containing domain protein n=1 Tax=Aspergillus stella-maris TaxID=1810926 RepID=UPI003CCDE4F4
MDSLLRLPNELLLDIAAFSNSKEIARLTCTCRRLHSLLNIPLYCTGLDEDPPAIVRAAESCNAPALQLVFQYTKPSPDALYEALKKATAKGNEGITRLLLDRGAPIRDSAPEVGGSPLYLAAIKRSLSVVEVLLKAGASPIALHVYDVAAIIAKSTKVGRSSDSVVSGARFDPRILQLLVSHGMDIASDPVVVKRLLKSRSMIPLLEILIDLGLNPMYPGHRETLLRVVMNRVEKQDSDEYASLVRKCADVGANINHPSTTNSLLHTAAGRGMTTTVRALIECGAVVDVRRRHRLTPLQAAPEDNNDDNVDIMQALLDAGADMTAVDEEGELRVLIRVINQNNRPCMRLLLDRGLELVPAVPLSQLLLAAAHLNDSSAVRRLLAASEKSTSILLATDKEQNTALMIASRLAHDDIIKLLFLHLQGLSPFLSLKNKTGDSSLHLAMYSGSPSTARLLIASCPDHTNEGNSSALTPLAIAVQNQPADVVNELIEKGADMNWVDNQRQSLLHHAVIRGDLGIVKVLLEQNSPRTSNNKGQTPFALAMQNEKPDLVKMFLDHGEPADQCDQQGKTPLMTAVERGSTDIVKVLVEAGASTEPVALLRLVDEERVALSMIQKRNTPDIARLYLSLGAGTNISPQVARTILVRAIQRRWLDLATIVLQTHGANLDIDSISAFSVERTALGWAAGRGYVDVVRELLRLGADPLYRDSLGQTTFSFAAQGGSVEAMVALVEHIKSTSSVDTQERCPAKAALESEDIDGNTPLSNAVSFGRIKTVDWLRTWGVNMYHTNRNGQTAMDVAADLGLDKMVSWFEQHGMTPGNHSMGD